MRVHTLSFKQPFFLRSLLSVAITGAFSVVALQASADMSSRYIDSDGDLVADIPADESQWVDPDTLIFAYTPVEDPAIYADVWADFLDHLADATGKRVQFFPVQSNAAQQEALRAGRLHVAGFNTGGVPVAVNCGGFRPFTIMAAEDGSFGYEMEIITYPGSDIESVEDIQGSQLAFTSPTSNSGFRAPSALLRSEYGMEADEDFETAFSGSHDNSILGVVNKDYEAAAVANSVLNRMLARDVIEESDYVSIFTSETFPTTAYGTAHNLTPELQEQIQEAFFSYDWEGTALKAEFANSGEAQFIPITYQQHWNVIRTIADANGVTYDCD
ncbi:phosphate/phosphite/phosphonate ABC transporter substrate-binding protein [Halomonas sp. TBZ9]|uniref:Phosphate/phosphite/phosphonate ABC transporter substrate-binding protein n=1 Tax=Vreelandella azerica TaxID=2732867 RepID=A0A7Y3TYC2_9GAMM|nr:phosphate/phosphite/phosphonate ABC transporter substrate-binding protein [Halomonas azerica]NOG32453.1 phosphate/phosphite/phosphonate ABC transporter substrate-binding protein [Halomonas azerica]